MGDVRFDEPMIARQPPGRGNPTCMAHFEVAPGVIAHCCQPFEHFGGHGASLAALPGPMIARPSVASLLLDLKKAGASIGTATGFVVQRDGVDYVITNEHVALGKGLLPDTIEIVHNKAGALGHHVRRSEPLYDASGDPLWYVHMTKGVDVVALPLTQTASADLHTHDPWAPGPGIAAGVTEGLSIVGFPFGLTVNGLAVWTRGFVASEPDLDWSGLPVFLIDARTRQGQSGSPVIAYYASGSVPMAGGGVTISSGPMEQFFGVYSGRLIGEESDLGVVWKPRVVPEIVAAKTRADSP